MKYIAIVFTHIDQAVRMRQVSSPILKRHIATITLLKLDKANFNTGIAGINFTSIPMKISKYDCED